MLEAIAKPVLAGADVKLNTKVVKVSSRERPEDKVQVLTAKGRTLAFDEVVFTAPLGWLQRNIEAFDPPLPAQLTKSIQAISYGSLEKVGIYTWREHADN